MTTIYTIYDLWFHSQILLSLCQLSHPCILPRILNCIHKVHILWHNIDSPEYEVGPVNIWLRNFSKYSLAIVNPEWKLYSLRPHGVLFVWCLEPSIFSTILPCPLSQRRFCIDSCIWKVLRVIIMRNHILLISILFYAFKLLLRSLCG